jgi:ankyrin repeat protein
MTWFFAYEHKHVVGYLLRDGITFTQLMIVSHLGLENLAQLLLRGNIDVNEKSRAAAKWPTRTALSTAVLQGHVNVVRLLLEKGAEPNADFDVQRGLLLHHTIVFMLAYLRHAPLNQLEVAITVETKTIVRSMLEKRAIATNNNSGQVALREASPRDCEDLTELLLKRANDPSLARLRSPKATTRFKSHPDLLHAEFVRDKHTLDFLAICRLLLECGADPNAIDVQGRTALDILIPDNRKILRGEGWD